MRHTLARVLVVAMFAGLLFAPASTVLIAADQKDSVRQQRESAESKGPQTLFEHKGLTPGQWLTVWWQEVLSIAAKEGEWHPLRDGGAFGGNHRTVFLAGKMQPLDSQKVTIPVTAEEVRYLA